MVTMFMNAMSDIVIKRFNVHKKPQDQIKTRLVYAPKQRVLNDLLDRDQNLQLPVMAVSIGGMSRDTTRVFNKLLGSYNLTTSYKFEHERMPIPIDLSLNVSLMTKFQSDMDQILTHLLPYINPYFTVSWRTPGRPDFEIRSNVFWGGNVNIQYPVDLNATTIARVIADIPFTFKGWLFQAKADEPIGSILTVHSDYQNVPQSVPFEYLLDRDRVLSSTPSSDYIQYIGIPPQPSLVVPYTATAGSLQQFVIYGAGFTKLNNLYLSGEPVDSFSTTQNPFSSVPDLSAAYPAFNGYKVPEFLWTYDGDISATFTMPSGTAPGLMDIILEGPIGYGKLTDFVRRNLGNNPYREGTPEYDNYVPYQKPYLSGVRIF